MAKAVLKKLLGHKIDIRIKSGQEVDGRICMRRRNGRLNELSTVRPHCVKPPFRIFYAQPKHAVTHLGPREAACLANL